MQITKLFETIEYTPLQGVPGEAARIVFDSRLAGADALFVCLSGAYMDGHDYAREAYDRGCRSFLCQRPLVLPPDAFVAQTEDTRSALAEISAVFYDHPARKLKIIGITGTKGKTTTALLIQSILEKNGIPCGYVGSNGVLIRGKMTPTRNTTPESLYLQKYFARMVEAGLTHAVIEVSSQALEHNRVQGIDFDTCVFTNLSPDHVGKGEHDSFESYRAAKRRLFAEYGCKRAVYNADDPAWAFMLDGVECPKLGFSVGNKDAFLCAQELQLFRQDSILGICFACTCGEKTYPVTMRTPGAFSVHNGLAALAVCAGYGVPVEMGAQSLAQTNVAGRFELVSGKPGCTFVVDYAHNGLSLQSALRVLRQYRPERLICLFGSVGGRSQSRRRELAEAASKFADLCIITSDNPDKEPPEAIIREITRCFPASAPYLTEPDRERAVRIAVRMAQPGDIVLFAGKGHEAYQLIDGQKLPFSERSIIESECAAISAGTEHKEETICI